MGLRRRRSALRTGSKAATRRSAPVWLPPKPPSSHACPPLACMPDIQLCCRSQAALPVCACARCRAGAPVQGGAVQAGSGHARPHASCLCSRPDTDEPASAAPPAGSHAGCRAACRPAKGSRALQTRARRTRGSGVSWRAAPGGPFRNCRAPSGARVSQCGCPQCSSACCTRPAWPSGSVRTSGHRARAHLPCPASPSCLKLFSQVTVKGASSTSHQGGAARGGRPRVSVRGRDGVGNRRQATAESLWGNRHNTHDCSHRQAN